MPIPELIDNVLPEGLYDCTVEEVAAVFGRIQTSDRRMWLTDQLRAYLDNARRSGIVKAVIIDGGYVTAKAKPDDIDLIVVLPEDWDFTRELRPFEYNVVTRVGMGRMKYPFDPFFFAEGSDELARWVGFFSQVHPVKDRDLTPRTHKGLLRVVP